MYTKWKENSVHKKTDSLLIQVYSVIMNKRKFGFTVYGLKIGSKKTLGIKMIV
jgi:hypothetical protein